MKKPILPSEITLRFHPSNFLWGWWLVFSTAVLFSLWLSLSPLWAFFSTLVYAAASFWQWTQLVATTSKFSVQKFSVDVFGQMTITNTLGQWWRIEVLPDSVVHHRCMVLHLAYAELQSEVSEEKYSTQLQDLWRLLRPTRLLILFDHADPNSQKALRVWLKWGLSA
ncbi:MAG TPA: hypothetical protein VK958_08970 [Methylophilus sp.]|uniref:hypothetical protein n=1 Tax=Methylophilus sp. TaxID=29541 RepID=UPI002BF20317|nr:hypothetical protein [Methylophilus sp.]HSH87363.1 hypothetical protein [Methylophilus sp.]